MELKYIFLIIVIIILLFLLYKYREKIFKKKNNIKEVEKFEENNTCVTVSDEFKEKEKSKKKIKETFENSESKNSESKNNESKNSESKNSESKNSESEKIIKFTFNVIEDETNNPENEKLFGELTFKLYNDICPLTCQNFIRLSKMEYKDSIVHRLIPQFMVQMGDFEQGNGLGGHSIYGKTFVDENFIKKHNKRGILSMANSGKDTNGSQFFITFAPTPHLDGKHVVFGEVIDGFDVLDKMEKLQTDNEDCPKHMLIIRKTTFL